MQIFDKSILKHIVPALMIFALLRSNASAQTAAVYVSKNTATATGMVNGSQVSDISNNGTTVTKLNDDNTVINFPMIGLGKTASSPVIQADGSYNVDYTFTIKNFGTLALNNVQVTDDLSAVFATPVTFTIRATASTTGGLIANTAFNGVTNKNVLAGTNTLATGTTGTITIRLNIKPNGVYGIFNNTATATANTSDNVPVFDKSVNNNSPDANGNNNPFDDTSLTPLTLLASDIQVLKTVTGTAPLVGSNVTFTVTATNKGPGAAAPVVVNDLLSAGFSFVSSDAGASYNSATGVWTVGTLAANAVKTLNIVATVNANQASSLYKNSASVNHPGDPQANNNQAEVVLTPVPKADLKISNTDGIGTYTPGTQSVYTVTVTNDGPSDVSGALVTDALPAGITAGSWTAVYTGGASGTGSGTGGISEQVNLPKGSTVVYTWTVDVPSGFTGNLTSTATVAAPQGVTDPTPGNNSAADTDTQRGIVDLAVTKVVDNKTPDAGSLVVFSVGISNGGPSDATGVRVADKLPTGYTFVSAAPSAGTYDAVSGEWIVGHLSTGANASLVVTAKVNADKAQTDYKNEAVAQSDEPDRNAGNNTASEDVTVAPVTDLSVQKTIDVLKPDAGSNVTFTVSAMNAGPSIATGVNVTDLLPAGYSFVKATPSTGGYDHLTGLWTIGSLGTGSTATMTVTAGVKPDQLQGNYENGAVVTGTEKDPDLSNNTSKATSTPEAVIDLQVNLAVSKPTPSIGQEVIFTITAVNNGPSNAAGVVVSGLLPSGYGYVSSAVERGSYDSVNGKWAIGNLAVGEVLKATIVARIIPAGVYGYTAVIAGNEKEITLQNNVDDKTVTPQSLPVASNDSGVTIPNTAVTIDVLNNDSPANFRLNPATVKITEMPAHGTVSVDATAGNVTYTPDPGYFGTDAFTYTVTDLNGGISNAATVDIRIKKGPTAIDDATATVQETPVTIPVLTNDEKGDALLNSAAITVVALPKHGTVTTDPVKGVLIYTPETGYYGEDGLVYTVKDQNGVVSNPANVVITVNKPPQTFNDTGVAYPSVPLVMDILANDAPGSGNLIPSGVKIITQPQHGQLTVDASGKATYVADPNYDGPDSFTYTVTDVNGAVSNVATGNITVNGKPVIGLAKAATSVTKTVNGTYDVVYLITVGNYGLVDLNDVRITDDLAKAFAGANIKITSVKVLGSLRLNSSYNGVANIQLLDAGNQLKKGQVEQLELSVNVNVSSDGVYKNVAYAQAVAISGQSVEDQSTDGLNPVKGGDDVSANEPTPVNLKKQVIRIPGGFSPNNDGSHDRFVIENNGFRRISIEIFNRWGNRVYKSVDYQNNWDGKCTEGIHIGEEAPDGTYYYIVVVDKEKHAGYITISR